MKGLGSSDSLGALMSICPTSTEENNNHHAYTSDQFQNVLEDEEGCVEESGSMPAEKKRRLRVEQVKALEKNFEVENKLEPERKVKLAQELGLQPRQVAVWFQNRRARWKTKQLERDYGVLKANYDALKLNYDSLRHENEALLKEIQELKAKLHGDGGQGHAVIVKEEAMMSENEKLEALVNYSSAKSDGDDDDDATVLNFGKSFKNGNGVVGGSVFGGDFKDGSSDSDSSAVLNNEDNNSNNKNINSPNHYFLSSNGSSCSKSTILEEAHKAYEPQFVKVEEHNFFNCHEDSCTTFFCDDQPPTLHWYNPDEWN